MLKPNFVFWFKQNQQTGLGGYLDKTFFCLNRINRLASEDIEIKGLKILKGMDCTYCPSIMHFMDEYWEEPMKFNPER